MVNMALARSVRPFDSDPAANAIPEGTAADTIRALQAAPTVIPSSYPSVSLGLKSASDTLPPAPDAPRKILVAFRDEARRQATGSMLRDNGFRVLERSPEELVVDVLVHAPDLVLLEASCVDACHDLRSFDASRMLPIVLVGAEGDGEHVVVRGFEAGADDYVEASDRAVELRARINAQLQHRRDREMLRWAREQRSSFRQLAMTDPLTRTGNRRSGLHALERALGQQAAVAVMMLDLDHFKAVNDTHGHDAGDMVLRRVAQALREVGLKGATVSRWGGEEFMVVLSKLIPGTADSVGEAYRRAVSDLVFKGGSPRGVTTSIGVAHWDGRGPAPTGDELLGLADVALYDAKRAGRNCAKTRAFGKVPAPRSGARAKVRP
jgi:two-component system cell cycle response regulator